MWRDADIVTMEDALNCIRHHFTESDGLLAHIEGGGEIDDNQVSHIEKAFQVIQAEWKDKTLISKAAVRLVYTAIAAVMKVEQSRLFSKNEEDEVTRFVENVNCWTDALFFTQSAPLSEEITIALVLQHLLGTPSFNVELILGDVNHNALIDLLGDLKTLASIWESREDISKLAAQAMLGSPGLFNHVATLFRGPRQQTLQDAERRVNEAIFNCLK